MANGSVMIYLKVAFKNSQKLVQLQSNPEQIQLFQRLQNRAFLTQEH